MATERKLKGINFLGMLEALEREHQAETLDRVTARLEGEAGDAVRQRQILASGWYPASWYDALLSAIVEEVHGDSETARSLSRSAVQTDFSTLFRIVRLFMSPEKALQQAMRVSNRYVDGGEIEVVEASQSVIHLRLRDYHGYSHLMWWDFVGGIEGVLTNLGAEDITARMIAGGGDGDHHLEVVLRWRI